MLWSFIAVCFSAWLYVDASYRGPAWRRWVFKPVTLILLLLLAWQAPMFNAISYLVLAGLCASLLGDALTLLPRQRVMYAVGAFFLSHLLYTIWFASQLTLSFFWPLPLVLLVFGALLMAVIRNGLNLMGASNDIQYIVIGAVIILAVTIDVFRNKAEARARKMAAQ